ncbi:MAG: prohibitin family protein, partial [Saprospiraceae bacterium]|nr:prohibitin family protein [Saprospiraceae bacterium]
MFLIFLGIFALVLGASLAKANPNLASVGKIARYVGLVIILLGISTACFVQIEPGEVGVKTLFGKIQSGTLTEGLNFVNPLVEVKKFDVRTQNYTMSAVRDEGAMTGDDAIRVLAADGLEVIIDLSVLYHIIPDKAPDILRNTGTREVITDKIIRPLARTKIRDNAVFYDAVALYSTKREEFQQKITQTIEKDFADRGIVLEDILIRNITLPESVKLAIESKINAEQEAQKMKFVLDKERQEADRKRVEAQGISDYQRILTSTLTDKLL